MGTGIWISSAQHCMYHCMYFCLSQARDDVLNRTIAPAKRVEQSDQWSSVSDHWIICPVKLTAFLLSLDLCYFNKQHREKLHICHWIASFTGQVQLFISTELPQVNEREGLRCSGVKFNVYLRNTKPRSNLKQTTDETKCKSRHLRGSNPSFPCLHPPSPQNKS